MSVTQVIPLKIPTPTRPVVADYGIPEDEVGLLSWDYVRERMAPARNYWLSTTRPDGRPHAMPVWGIWQDDTLYFGGGPKTRWSRNLAVNPAVTVHLESGSEVVIFEGTVAKIDDDTLMEKLDDAYEAKYDIRHGPPIWQLYPDLVFAWGEYPTTTTRWVFRDV